MSKEEKDQETAHKVIAIMQAITEDLDDRGKRAWRKMLGTGDGPEKSSEDDEESE